MGNSSSLKTRVSIYQAVRQISSGNRAVRENAAAFLKMHSEVSIPILEKILNRSRDHRRQFFAAAILHKLGHPRGIQFLMGYLVWRLPSSPNISCELAEAILEIDSPEASAALLDVWPSIPIHSDNIQIHQLICKLCAEMKENRILEVLLVQAHRLPELFLKTVTVFGEQSLPYIEKLLQDKDPARRKLAVDAAKSIQSSSLYHVLVPMLRDSSPEIRDAVPAAMLGIRNAKTVVEEIEFAVLEGWSSIAAVQAITSLRKSPDKWLAPLLDRWPPSNTVNGGDTKETVLYVLSHLTTFSPDSTLIRVTVCRLLERAIDYDIAKAAMTYLAEEQPSDSALNECIVSALLPWLSAIDPNIRAVTAEALSRYGSNIGVQHEALLNSSYPRETVLHKFQVMLRGSNSDLNTPSQSVRTLKELDIFAYRPPGWDDYLQRDIVPVKISKELIRQLTNLLKNVCKEMISPSKLQNTPDLLASGIAAIRTLGEVYISNRAIISMELQKIVMQPDSLQHQIRNNYQEVTRILRSEAAASLSCVSRETSFVVFLEAACTNRLEVQLSGISALGFLGDVRAMPLLTSFLNGQEESLKPAARAAIKAVQDKNPEIITLLRASVESIDPSTLLRVVDTEGITNSKELLRHSAS